MDLHDRAFGDEAPDPALERDLEEAAGRLTEALLPIVRDAAPDLLVVQNAWAIPMQLPLAAALGRVVEATGLPTLSHEHDYWWERERFARTRVRPWLDRWFPFDAPTVRHLAINSPARDELRERRGIDATVVPNVMDFGAPRPRPDEEDAVREVRDALGLGGERRLILQPTRVVPRKGIELAIELLARMDDPRDVLVISHAAGDEGTGTLARLRAQAERSGVDLRYAGERFAPERSAGPLRAGRRLPRRGRGELSEPVRRLRQRPARDHLPPARRGREPLRGVRPRHRADRRALRRARRSVDDARSHRCARLLDDPLRGRRAMTEHNPGSRAAHFGMDALRARLESPLRSLGVGAVTASDDALVREARTLYGVRGERVAAALRDLAARFEPPPGP